MYEAILALAVVCFLAVSVYYWRSPAFSVFHPLTFYLGFHGLLFVVRPILAWTRNYDGLYRVYQFTPSMSDKITVIAAATLGMLCFAFFSLRAGNSPMRFAEGGAMHEERRQLSQIFVWVLAICAPPATYSLYRSYAPDGNLSSTILDRGTGVFINTTQSGYITDLQLLLVSLSVLIIWLGRFRWWSFLPLVAFIMLRAGTGGRGPFVAAAVSAGLLYLYEKRIRYPGLGVVLATIAVFAGFSAVGSDRGASIRQALGIEEQSFYATNSERADRFLESMDFGNMEFFEYIVYVVPQRSGTYDYFLDNLQIFTEPVPRILWPGKPIGAPIKRFELFDYGYPIGMTRSLPGEGWHALGWLGVLIWCGLWGHVLGRIYTRFVSGEQSTFKIAAYMIFLPTLVIGLRDGLLLTMVRQVGAYLAPVVLWYIAARLFGVPSIVQFQAAMRHRREQGRIGPTGDEAAGALPEDLPPAVRRRRLALAKAKSAAPHP